MHRLANEIVEYAKSLQGVKWLHLGRDPKRGIDCVGLPILICLKFDIPCEDGKGYSRRPNPSKFLFYVRKNCEAIDRKVADHGDLLCVPDGHTKLACHIGILEIDPKGVKWFIHAWAHPRNPDGTRGRVVRTMITPKVWDKVIHIARFKESRVWLKRDSNENENV